MPLFLVLFPDELAYSKKRKCTKRVYALYPHDRMYMILLRWGMSANNNNRDEYLYLPNHL